MSDFEPDLPTRKPFVGNPNQQGSVLRQLDGHESFDPDDPKFGLDLQNAHEI